MLYALVGLTVLCCTLQWAITTVGNYYDVKCNIASPTNIYDLYLFKKYERNNRNAISK